MRFRGRRLRRPLTVALPALALSLLGAAYVTAEPAGTEPGIQVRDGRLVEADGTDLVLRGINHGHAFGKGPASVYRDIKATGANAVRVALAIGHKWPRTNADEVRRIVAQCKDNRLICVLDAHDTVGWGQEPGAASMAEAVDYWITLKRVLDGQEKFVVVNIANEPSGHGINDSWSTDTATAIRRLRRAGFRHTFMVDAPNWGNDQFHTMRDNAAQVLAADPNGDTVFSVHMYGPYDTSAAVEAYLSAFVDRRLPIVVGEFSDLHTYGDPDEDSIMAYCAKHDLGYLGWSWSGNSPEFAFLDMVTDYDRDALTGWGKRFVDGPDGLRATSREATVYGSIWRFMRR